MRKDDDYDDDNDDNNDDNDKNYIKEKNNKKKTLYFSERKLVTQTDGYYSDSEIYKLNHYNKQNNINNKRSKCDESLITDELINITDKKLKGVFGWFSKNKRRPVKLTCCNMNLCTECLIKCIKEKNDVICPFCKFDHNKRDQDYIKTYHVGKCNRKAWIKWWSNHMEIMEQGLFSNK